MYASRKLHYPAVFSSIAYCSTTRGLHFERNKMVLFARKKAGKRTPVISYPSVVSEAPQVPCDNNSIFSCNVKFLGSSLVGVTYNTRSILDGHAKKRRGTKRVNLTAGPDLIFCASKKSPTNVLYVHSRSDVRGFYVHPQKRRVFGYALANPESGTVSLVCFKTPRKSSTNGEQVQSAWQKASQSRCSAQLSPSSLEVVAERTEATPTAPPPPPPHVEDIGSPTPAKRCITPPPATPPRPIPAPRRKLKQREGQLPSESAPPTLPVPKPLARVLAEGTDAPFLGTRPIPAPRRKRMESESHLNGVVPPTPKPRTRAAIGETDTPVIRPVPAPRKRVNVESPLHNSLMSTPPTPKLRPRVATEEKVSALECAASTTELAPPVPLTRVAGSRHLDEPIYDTVPAEDNVDTDPVCDVCGGGMDPDHAKEMLLYDQIHRELQASSLGIRDIAGITIHTRTPLPSESQTELASCSSETWELPDREPPNWPTPDPATIPPKPEVDDILKELRGCSTSDQSLPRTGAERDGELLEEVPEESAGNPGSDDDEVREQMQLLAQHFQRLWIEMVQEGVIELRHAAREIMTTMMDGNPGQERASTSQKDLAELPSHSSTFQTSDSGMAVKQAKAAVPTELSGIAAQQKSKNPPRDFTNMLFAHRPSRRSVSREQTRTDSQQSKKTATSSHPHPLTRQNLCTSFSDSQIVKGRYASKCCLSGFSGMFHQNTPKPSLAGSSGEFQPVKQEQPVNQTKPVPRRRRRVKFFNNTTVRQ